MVETLRKYHYQKRVFYAPIWKEIYTKDTQRLESIDEAMVIDKSLRKVYQTYGYELIELPFTRHCRKELTSFFLKSNSYLRGYAQPAPYTSAILGV